MASVFNMLNKITDYYARNPIFISDKEFYQSECGSNSEIYYEPQKVENIRKILDSIKTEK